MRKKLIALALMAVLLIALLIARGCGKKDKTPLDGEPDAAQPVVELPAEKLMGEVTALPDGSGVTITVKKDGEQTVHTFVDVQADDWCLDAVNYVVSNGLMNGTLDPDGTERFRPDFGMTRAQFAMILYRFVGGEPVASPRRTYTDVPDYEWYYDCVNWADSNGYITGKAGADTFGVNEYFSCEEVLMVLHHVAGDPASNASLEDYPYAPKVSERGLSAVRWAWETGLIAEDECVWYPTQAISRAQIALLLMRYDQLIG